MPRKNQPAAVPEGLPELPPGLPDNIVMPRDPKEIVHESMNTEPPQEDFRAQEVAMLREQVGALGAQLAQLTQLMTSGGKLSATNFAAGPGMHASGEPLPRGRMPGYPADVPFDGGPTAEYPDGIYYVRIKPYDPRRGQKRKRQYFHELRRAVNGGTGRPGNIPEWVPVTTEQASALSQYLQDPNDPMSPMVLDIVTPEERELIDRAEGQIRANALGLAGMAPHSVLGAMQRPGMVTAHVGGMQRNLRPAAPQPTVLNRGTPSLMADVAEHQRATSALAALQNNQPAPRAQRNIAPARAGRAAALQGLPGQGGPGDLSMADVRSSQIGDRGVSEDLTAEAMHDQEAGRIIERAAPLVARAEHELLHPRADE
jgi:hypothetical protein